VCAVLFARTSKALERMNEQFRERKVEKVYWAIVKNKPVPASGTLVHYLVKDESKNKSKAFSTENNNALKCELSYRTIKHSDNYSLLEINPVTGRHHQIRVQLSEIGCPIKGDLKYGARRSNPDGSISLHARKLIFNHPVTKLKIEIVAPVPNEKLWMEISSDHS
jgi:23S rRNA pseudouridine1911/1915/1917 synthase